MFANEKDVLEYFYESGNALNIDELEAKFDNSPRKEPLEVLTALETKNYLENNASALWNITKRGEKKHLADSLPASYYDKRNLIVAIIAAIISLAALIVSLC